MKNLFSLAMLALLSVSAVAADAPPREWDDFPAMYEKSPGDCRFYTHAGKDVFTFGRLMEQLRKEADGRELVWSEPEQGAAYQLQAWRFRKIDSSTTAVSPLVLRFAPCARSDGVIGAQIVSVKNPENGREMAGRAVDGLLYSWFKRYF